jgi:hypothetical protein
MVETEREEETQNNEIETEEEEEIQTKKMKREEPDTEIQAKKR